MSGYISRSRGSVGPKMSKRIEHIRITMNYCTPNVITFDINRYNDLIYTLQNPKAEAFEDAEVFAHHEAHEAQARGSIEK